MKTNCALDEKIKLALEIVALNEILEIKKIIRKEKSLFILRKKRIK